MIITDFIVCENIREERSGQHSLIGVFHENIIFHVTPSNRNVWPKPMTLAFLVRVLFEEEDIEKNICKIGLSAGINDDLTLLGPLDISKEKMHNKGLIVLAVALNNFPIKNTGDFTIHLKAYNAKDEVVAEMFPSTVIKVTEVVVDGEK